MTNHDRLRRIREIVYELEKVEDLSVHDNAIRDLYLAAEKAFHTVDGEREFIPSHGRSRPAVAEHGFWRRNERPLLIFALVIALALFGNWFFGRTSGAHGRAGIGPSPVILINSTDGNTASVVEQILGAPKE